MRARLLAAVVSLAAVVGCSDDGGGAGGSEDTSASSPVDRSTLEFAPVPEQLDIGAVPDACGLLSPAQRDELGLPVTSSDSPRTCDLGTAENSHLLSIHTELSRLDRVHSNCYESETENDVSPCDSWTADTIDGYPIIRAPADSGFGVLCNLYLGVNDRSSIMILDGQVHKGGPDCTVADKAATFILETLR
ncbi:DUF3558 domain-containing protein [Actinophytocola gossypii]|uniref:DUF3558 family protein n=1 Tax=Actinophytocola gossypii TaxID=2812003 RepID=A0ABT2JFD4_9PSEU|nr:DUF3558 domain-containing protein [Actinophytocola gossypii]MCT2586587.1 DUF3558 family protein [Actinophytocola gossypii]